MKRRIQSSLAIALLMFTSAVTLAAQDAGSAFADKTLEAAVKKQVFASEALTREDLERLSTLKVRGAGIQDLKGLEKCLNLAALDLADNQISDLSPLKDLKGIQTIDLSGNRIERLEPWRD